MAALEKRAFDARIGLHALCKRAGISGTVITRWRDGTGLPSLPTIGKLEDAIAAVENEKAAA